MNLPGRLAVTGAAAVLGGSAVDRHAQTLGRHAHQLALDAVAVGVMLLAAAAVAYPISRQRRRRRTRERYLYTAVRAVLGLADDDCRCHATWSRRWPKRGDIVRLTVRWGHTVHVKTGGPVDAALRDIAARMTGGPVTVTWAKHGKVTISRRSPLPTRVDHPVGALKGDPRIPFATGRRGYVAWNPMSMAPHIGVTGATGKGKTRALITIIIQAAARGYRVHMIDPKRVSLVGLKGWPGVAEHVTGTEPMMAAVDRLYAEMMTRYEEMERQGRSVYKGQPVLVVIEELTSFLKMLATLGKPAQPTVDHWQDLVRLGRQARFHIAVGVQRPDAKIIDGEVRSNIGQWVAVGDLDEHLARMIGVTTPISEVVPGRAIVVTDGHQQEAQVWFSPDPAGDPEPGDPELLARLRAVGARGEASDRTGGSVGASNAGAGSARTGRSAAVDAPLDGPSNRGIRPPLDLEKRAEIERLSRAGCGQREIARRVGVSPSTAARYSLPADPDAVEPDAAEAAAEETPGPAGDGSRPRLRLVK